MKKGFTLIELLAVIVILAIIALIVTPVVSNIVSNAKIAANARSVEGHIRNVELAIISKAFGEQNAGNLNLYDGNKTKTEIEGIDSGLELPDNDNVTCNKYVIENGTVLTASGCIDSEGTWSKTYNYSNSEGAVVFSFKGTITAPASGETHKGIVYMDPTDPETVCSASNTNVSGTANNPKCKKFYIYNYDATKYYMIMDRNTTASVTGVTQEDYVAMATNDENGLTEAQANTNWSSGSKTLYGPLTAMAQVATDTAGWTVGTARLIRADEIAHIVGADSNDTIKWKKTNIFGTNDTSTKSSFFFLDGAKNSDPTTYSDSNGWQKQYANMTTKSEYAWLYDYTNGCYQKGCNTEVSGTGGYWTSDTVTNDNYAAWMVMSNGTLNTGAISAGDVGIRPVLEVPKKLIG